MAQIIFQGAKPVNELDLFATHWAVGSGHGKRNLLWMEIDGTSGAEKEQGDDVSRNTINGQH